MGTTEKPQTPAVERPSSQPASPVKKRRKVSRSHSVNTQSNQPIPEMMPHGGFSPSMMGHPHAYDDPNMHHPMSGPGSHMGPMGPVHPGMHGQPVAPGQSMMHPHHPGSHHQMGSQQQNLPPHMHPSHPAHSQHLSHAAGHPAARFMRPGMPAQHSMHPGGPPNMHHPSQGMNPQMQHSPGGPMSMGGPMPSSMPGGPPGGHPGMPQQSSGRVYPTNQPMIFNASNPNAPPIYPCGSCHKEVHDSDQAILCESGCNFWFHRQCSCLSENAYQFLTKEVYAEWVCDQCLAKKSIPVIKVKP